MMPAHLWEQEPFGLCAAPQTMCWPGGAGPCWGSVEASGGPSAWQPAEALSSSSSVQQQPHHSKAHGQGPSTQSPEGLVGIRVSGPQGEQVGVIRVAKPSLPAWLLREMSSS